MLIRSVLVISLACALSACNSDTPPPTLATPPSAPATSSTPSTSSEATADTSQANSGINATLVAHHWLLHSATSADGQRIDALFPNPELPIQLDFIEDRIAVSHVCNRMGGNYLIENNALKVAQMISTQMACAEPLMRAETAMAERFDDANLNMALSIATPAVLSLTSASGDVLTFHGQATAATRFGTPAERVFLEVAPQRVACPHPLIPEHQCLHVREITYDEQGLKTAEGDWEFFYDQIEGYTHEAGIRNILRLDRYRIATPPADGASQAYVLDMIVMSGREDSENTTQ